MVVQKMNLSKIQRIVFIEYKNNGYLDMWNTVSDWWCNQRIYDIAELGLIITEVSEAIETIRNSWKENNDSDKVINSDFSDLAKECADIIIRTLNFMSRKGFDAEKVILHKNKINLNRGLLHGKSV
jgi:hypothetical protein